MALSSPGIGSNLDINSIVSQLMSVEQQPLVNLAKKESSFQAKLSALGNLKGALSTFQNTLKSLADVSKFKSVRATITDSTIATASATSSATAGTYSLEVNKLAQAQKLVSAGQANITNVIGTGTLTFDFGTIAVGAGSFDSATGKYTDASFSSNGSGTKTVTIDSSNSSLSGIRDAINQASIGVTAAIVNDGGESPYRLVLTETSTGKTNSMKISVSGDAALENLLGHDPGAAPAGQALSETVTAQNAEFKVDGIAISKSSNTVTDAIPGVTLTLAKTNTGSPTNLAVSLDSAAITGSVGQFVFAFNQINQTLRDLSAYNSSTKQGAVLNGDATVRTIQTQIRNVLTAPVGGGASTFTVLSQIGVTVQKDGTLAVDNTKLQKAMDDNVGDVAALFAATGKASDSLAAFTSATDKTVPGTYALSVSQLATQGKTVGGVVAGLTVDATNDTLEVELDGVTATVTLAQASYADAAALAAEVQSKINGASAFADAGKTVTVSEAASVFTITSDGYGSNSSVSITGGNGKNNLVGANPTDSTGLDVAGSINGIAATGSGQFLLSAAGDAQGLKIQVTGGALGERGTVSFSRGYADQLNKLVDSMLGTEGAISARTNGLNASIKSITEQRERLNDRLVDIEKRYRTQFTALDVLLSGMTKTSSFLQQQLDNLPKIE